MQFAPGVFPFCSFIARRTPGDRAPDRVDRATPLSYVRARPRVPGPPVPQSRARPMLRGSSSIRVVTSVVATLGLFPVGARVSAQRQSGATRLDQQLAPLRVVDPTMMDTTANACGDFFQFANGAWLARDTIPAAYSSSGVARDMADRNELVVRSVLDEAMAKHTLAATSATQRKLGTFYASCMDSTGAESKGAAPVRPLLSRIDAIATRPQLLGTIAELQTNGANAVFAYFPAADAHDAAHYMVWLSQAGLGMPDRDYYTNTGAEADSLRASY